MAVWLSYIVPLRHPKIIHEREPAKVSLKLLPLGESWAWCLCKIPHRKLTSTLENKAHCRGNLIVSNQYPGAHVSVLLKLIARSNLFAQIHFLRLKLVHVLLCSQSDTRTVVEAANSVRRDDGDQFLESSINGYHGAQSPWTKCARDCADLRFKSS